MRLRRGEGDGRRLRACGIPTFRSWPLHRPGWAGMPNVKEPGGLPYSFFTFSGVRLYGPSERPSTPRSIGQTGMTRPSGRVVLHMLFGSRAKTTLPTREEALPGRDTRPFPVPSTHEVLGT